MGRSFLILFTIFKNFILKYQKPNGLLGVNRDTFNKLGTHRWADDRDLQQLYGISQRAAVPWKDHFVFKMKRLKKNKTRTTTTTTTIRKKKIIIFFN
jgi:hypothetical protein